MRYDSVIRAKTAYGALANKGYNIAGFSFETTLFGGRTVFLEEGGVVMDWERTPADTMVVESEEITLRDLVQAAADGVDTPQGLMEVFGLEEGTAGTEHFQSILDAFLPAIARLRSGGCGGG